MSIPFESCGVFDNGHVENESHFELSIFEISLEVFSFLLYTCSQQHLISLSFQLPIQ
jgi:hypothetical protein